jgi:hypothetical protein
MSYELLHWSNKLLIHLVKYQAITFRLPDLSVSLPTDAAIRSSLHYYHQNPGYVLVVFTINYITYPGISCSRFFKKPFFIHQPDHMRGVPSRQTLLVFLWSHFVQFTLVRCCRLVAPRKHINNITSAACCAKYFILWKFKLPAKGYTPLQF